MQLPCDPLASLGMNSQWPSTCFFLHPHCASFWGPVMGLHWDLVIPAKPGHPWPFQGNRRKVYKEKQKISLTLYSLLPLEYSQEPSAFFLVVKGPCIKMIFSITLHDRFSLLWMFQFHSAPGISSKLIKWYDKNYRHIAWNTLFLIFISLKYFIRILPILEAESDSYLISELPLSKSASTLLWRGCYNQT